MKRKLAEIIDINPSRSLRKGTNAPYIAMENIEPFIRDVYRIPWKQYNGSGSKFQNGDTLLARITPCLENGKTTFVNSLPDQVVGFGSTEFIVLSGKKDVVDDLFVYYLCREPRFRSYAIQSMTGTSGRQRVQLNSIENFEIELPSLSEQHRISSVLSNLDYKINLNRLINETLEHIIQLIFKLWFIDFEFPDEHGRPYKSNDGRMMDSELGKIPIGWRVNKISSIVDIHGGGTPKTDIPEYWNGDIKWFTVKDAPNDEDIFVIDTEKKITKSGVENSAAQILPRGTIIITSRGTVGKLAIAGVPMAINQTCYGISGKDGYNEHFIYYLLRFNIDHIKRQTHGTVFDTITRQTFDTIKITIPEEELAATFEELISPLIEKILHNCFESHKIIELRDVLLPKLISGQIKVNHEDLTLT